MSDRLVARHGGLASDRAAGPDPHTHGGLPFPGLSLARPARCMSPTPRSGQPEGLEPAIAQGALGQLGPISGDGEVHRAAAAFG
jgi:hypothetical protein